MLTTNKTNSIVRSILGILLTVVLLTTTCPIIAYAAGDNLGLSTLDVFPALGVSSDTMDVNNGTINTLYGGGTVKDNRGTISSSLGTVFENHGTIEKLSAGHVGTNYGTINRIENTGSLGVNDGAGTVLFVGMGNEVFRNDGTIQVNIGNVSDNYGTVSDNYGTVIMHDGQVVYNYQNGIVTFEAKISGGKTIPAKGTIDNNKGSVEINSGTVEITENTGNIEIKNATVTVGKNSGNITVGNNAVLICSENKSDGLITKSSETAAITCTTNSGTIGGEPMYRIVFVGDDGQAKITACDKEENGMYYTQYEGVVLFTLPPEYECIDGKKWESSETVNTWILNAKPAEGDTRVTISCHKCTPGDYWMTKEKHWQICAGCGKMLAETEGAHTFGEFVPNDDATCVKDGTETGKCTVCGYKRTRTAVDSHLTSDHHEHIVIDQRVEPTETSTGLTQGSHCEDCNKMLTAQEIIPKIPHTCVSSSDYLYDGSTHWKICSICNEKFDEETHNNGNLLLNTEATCTEKATYYMQCDICGAVDHTQIVAAGDPLGHTFENGICTECGYSLPLAFDSVSLVLSGELGLNFYTVINDVEAVKDSYMLFEIGSKGETQIVNFSDAVLVGERYVFTCNVNALQMADTITVSFHYGDTVVGPKTTSVASYIDKVIENHNYDDTDPTVKLAKSILNYGHYAQIALSELHGFTLGTDYTVTNNKNDVTIANAADIEAYKATKTGNIDGITKVSRSLSLDHGTNINIYLTVKDEYVPDVNVTDKKGNAVEFTLEKIKDGRYLLVIPQIAAHQLGDMYTVSVDNGAMTINVSALSYAYSVLSSDKSEAQKLCVSALYEYYNAAITYRNTQ